jgi:hypothetical protein
MGPSFELYTYGPLTVPAGVVLKEAEKIIPLAEVFYYENRASVFVISKSQSLASYDSRETGYIVT